MIVNYSIAASRIIPSTTSDHKPVLVYFGMAENYGPLPFRYNQRWGSNEEAQKEVESVRKKNISGSPTFIWETKIKATKVSLKDWAKNRYKEPHKEKEDIKNELKKIQEELESSDSTIEKQAREKEVQWKIYRTTDKKKKLGGSNPDRYGCKLETRTPPSFITQQKQG